MSLHDRLFIRIADITFALGNADPALSIRIGDPTQKFLTHDTQPDSTIEARLDDLSPMATSGKKIFDSGSTWRLYEWNGIYEFTFTSAAFGSVPCKIARVQKDFSSAEVAIHRPYCEPGQPLYPLDYPLDELLLVHLLALGRGAEVHSCGVVDSNGDGLLFVGQSSAGKSTIARLWEGEPDITILSDDRIILRHLDGTLWMYGTPWHGDAGFALPNRAPLARIYFLRHGEKNELIPLSTAAAVGRMFACSFVPFYSPEGLEFTLGFLEQVAKAVPCYELRFVPDKRVVEFIQNNQD